MNKDDLYSILGVARTAIFAEIRDRFRFLSHAYHPDKFATETQRKTAEEQFKKVNDAYRILSDPASRARYDASRAGPSDPPPRASYQQPSSTMPRAQKRARHFRIIKWAFIVVAVFVGIVA